MLKMMLIRKDPMDKLLNGFIVFSTKCWFYFWCVTHWNDKTNSFIHRITRFNDCSLFVIWVMVEQKQKRTRRRRRKRDQSNMDCHFMWVDLIWVLNPWPKIFPHRLTWKRLYACWVDHTCQCGQIFIYIYVVQHRYPEPNKNKK